MGVAIPIEMALGWDDSSNGNLIDAFSVFRDGLSEEDGGGLRGAITQPNRSKAWSLRPPRPRLRSHCGSWKAGAPPTDGRFGQRGFSLRAESTQIAIARGFAREIPENLIERIAEFEYGVENRQEVSSAVRLESRRRQRARELQAGVKYRGLHRSGL
jgi:hypothetical protein